MPPTMSVAPRWRGLGALSVAALAVAMLGGSVIAQSPTPEPSPAAAVPSPGASDAPTMGPRIGACGPRWPRTGDRVGGRTSPRSPDGGWRQAPRRGHDTSGRQRPWSGRQQPWSGRQGPSSAPATRSLVRVATVTTVVGSVVMLATADGWTRTIDTTNVPITRAGTTITAADLPVGAAVRVTEERADDGTWSVTGLRVQQSVVVGSVASVDADEFIVGARDGSSVTIRVSDATSWSSGCAAVGDLASLEVGTQVAVQGIRAADGSIDATTVVTPSTRQPMRRHRGRDVPTPVTSPTPATSPLSGGPSA